MKDKEKMPKKNYNGGCSKFTSIEDFCKNIFFKGH